MSAESAIAEPLPLQPLLGDWPSAALARLEHESCVVRVIVASVRGSAPREPGACMLVDARGVVGTIGGGNLECEAIAAAREAIAGAQEATAGAREPTGQGCEPIARGRELIVRAHQPVRSGAISIHRLTLASDLAQCCGGVVELWVERLTQADRNWLAAAAASAQAGCTILTTRAMHAMRGGPERNCLNVRDSARFDRIRFDVEDGVPTLRERIDAPATSLWLYGAGHVGRAVVRSLAELPFQVTWVDSRSAMLNGAVPANTCTRYAEHPASLTCDAPASAYHLVMTHDHGIDFEVCRAILERGEFAWLGLIGSASKAAKFRARLTRAGIARERIARLVCPIGVGGLTSKLPAAIAAGVTVQLLQEIEHAAERALFQAGESGASVHRALHDDCAAEDCKSCRARQSVYR